MSQQLVFNSVETKIWSNLVIKGITNAMSGLSQMVNQEIKISALSIKQVPAKSMPERLGGPEQPVIGIYLTFSGTANGHLMLVHQTELAYSLVDMLMGNPPGTTTCLEAVEQSALGEMGNVTGTFFLNAIADSLGITLMPSPPLVMCDMAGAVLDVALAEILQQSDDVFVAESEFFTTDRKANGTFLVMPNPDFIRVALDYAKAQAGE
jgi:chemotaxis protein CheC